METMVHVSTAFRKQRMEMNCLKLTVHEPVAFIYHFNLCDLCFLTSHLCVFFVVFIPLLAF